jgi:hypothetical protein
MNCDVRNKSGCMTAADMCFDAAGRYRCTPALAPAREAGTLGIRARLALSASVRRPDPVRRLRRHTRCREGTRNGRNEPPD